jgi:hypothetical protein
MRGKKASTIAKIASKRPIIKQPIVSFGYLWHTV